MARSRRTYGGGRRPAAPKRAGQSPKTPAIFRRYAITNEADLPEAVTRLSALPNAPKAATT